ncbi:MAG: DUF302 domain-containing protein [Caldisphaeraceae archaeon]|nr:DUF302 domain-containing protein [Caldisphaeraceae archaeon]
MKTCKSKYEFQELKRKVESLIIRNGMNIMARIDYSNVAEGIGMKLNSSILYLFGNPRRCTMIMRNDMRAGLYLPQKILLWEDENKNSFVSYEPLSEPLSQLSGSDNEYIKSAEEVLKEIVSEVSTEGPS